MHLDAKSAIAGLPALSVRRLLRAADLFDAQVVVDCLRVPHDQATHVLARIAAEGLIECVGEHAPTTYEITNKGSQFRKASAARPLRRSTADARLQDFLSRVREVNGDSRFAYEVDRVVLFGSMLDATKKRVSDVDLGVRLRPRYADRAQQQDAERALIAQAIREGRRFGTIVDEMWFPRRQVYQHLKRRSRALSVMEYGADDDEWMKGQVIFDRCRDTE